MKVTLVNPPYPLNAHAHPPFIPLGLAYLGAVAEKAGHQVTVVDCQAEKLTVDGFRSRIAQVPSDVVGVTSTTLLYNSAKGILVAAKQAHPNAVTMMGGSHAQMHGAMMGANGMHEQVWTAVAKKLGLTYAELNAALQNGQTVAQLAQAKGVSLNDLKTAALDAMKASFAELVKQGVMTQQQADWMLDHMDDMPMFNFDQGFGPGASAGVRGRGMMGRAWQPPTGPQG